MKRRLVLYLILSMVAIAGLAIKVYSMVIDNTLARENVERATTGGYNFGYTVAEEEKK